ncbi:MAG: undecaprenyl-diphosphate phosphatase [Acidobacteriota bacterium]|jgi:undecaprenyl-diphosphatase|nr:undecaprenyl-diphosphate phosphatase [Acidobacteriota bacterium]
MELVAAAILGIVQGLTEFLPVSSTAHLILVPWFLGWNYEGLTFDVALHVGTAVSVVTFFFHDWIRLARELLLGIKEGNWLGNSDRRLAWYLVVGTLPAMVVGLAFEEAIENTLRSPLIIVFTLTALGALLLFAEKRGTHTRTIENFSWTDALCIGFSQAIALIPGVSRSGITMTTAMLRNSTRTSAARFSFLLSTPVILGAGILKAFELMEAVRHPMAGAEPVRWSVMLVGFLFAAVSGFLCIRYFLKYLQTKSFMPFVIYRFLLAALILVYFLKGTQG